MQEMSLFEMFDISPDDALKEEAKEKKAEKAKKATPKKKTSKTSKKEVRYALPLTVYTGYLNAFSIEKQDKEDMSLSEIKAVIAEKLHCKAANISVELADDKKTAYAAFSKNKQQVKGTITVEEDTKCILPDGRTFSLSERCEEPSVDIATVQEILTKEVDLAFAQGISVIKSGKDFCVAFQGNSLNKVLSFPITVTVYGRDMLLVTQEAYEAFVKDQGQEDVKYNRQLFTAFIVSKYPEFENRILLQYTEPEGDAEHKCVVNVVMEVKEAGNVANKEQLFSTNAKLFVMSTTPIQLEPSMFDNHDEVNEDAIIQYAYENISPIFKKDRCKAEYYEEEEGNFIYLTMKGSKKGASEVVRSEERYHELLKQDFTMFEYELKTGETAFIEKNPSAICMVVRDKGRYIPLIEKMPGTLYDVLKAFFSQVAKKYRTEVLVRIFYNVEEKKFEIDVPNQTVSACGVSEQSEDPFGAFASGRIVVAEIHSHCFYNAFFSSVDDADEHMAIVYGVFGGFSEVEQDTENVGFVVRSSSCGKYFSLTREDVFTDEMADEVAIQSAVDQLMLRADKALSVLS